MLSGTASSAEVLPRVPQLFPDVPAGMFLPCDNSSRPAGTSQILLAAFPARPRSTRWSFALGLTALADARASGALQSVAGSTRTLCRETTAAPGCAPGSPVDHSRFAPGTPGRNSHAPASGNTAPAEYEPLLHCSPWPQPPR